ncbi:MAG: hypothetical protein ABII23_09585 [bacterium]
MKNIAWAFFLGFAVLMSGCAGNRKMVKTFAGDPGELIEAEGVAPIVDGDLLNARKAALADAQKTAVELVVGVYITSETMIEKAVTIKSNILARTDGYITSYDIIKEGEEGKFYKVNIKAVVKLQEINQDLDKLGLLISPEEAENPRVTVIIEEEIDGNPSEAGDAEMAIFQALLDSNYPARESTHLSEQEIDNAIAGNTAFYKAIGEKLKVEIIIIGKVSAGLITKEGLGGFISYRASANLKAVRAVDGKLVVTASDVQSGVDINAAIAAAKALKQAAHTGGIKIADELAAKLSQQAVASLEVEGLSSIQDVREMQGFLEKMSEVKNVQLRTYAKGKAEIDIYIQTGSTQDIADHFTKTPRWKADILSVNAYEIKISIKEE